MKTTLRSFALILATVLPLSWAGAATTLQFNNNANNVVGGAINTLTIAAGGTFVLNLQINSTVATNAVDYWLSQFSGATAGAFTILSADFTGSAYNDPSFAGSFAADNFSNTTGAPNTSDGIVDGRIQPRNGPDLGSSTASAADNAAGIFQVVNITLQVAGNAASGLYQIRTFDYTGFGYSSTTVSDQPFTNQAAININVVPEPSAVTLLALGGIGSLGLMFLRRRRIA